MKKTIILIIIAISSGLLLGKYTFDRYYEFNAQEVFDYENNVYMIKYGTYNSYDEMINNTIDLNRYVFVNDNNLYTVYISITKTLGNAKKILTIYNKKYNDLEIEKVPISNDEFIQNLTEYEKLLDASFDEKNLAIVQNQILSSYEKLVNNYE